MTNSLEAWAEAVREADDLTLFSHVNPDGDTVGSVLALRLALLSLGKKVQIVCDGKIPEKFSFLSGAEAYLRPEECTAPMAAIAVDVSSPDMLGACRALFEGASRRLVIDHHATNPLFGDIHYVRGGESSCSLLIYEAIAALKVPMSREMGTCLMLGMSTDTGHFQYASTSAETLRAAGELVDLGVNISDISRRMYRSQPMSRMRLTQAALSRLHYEAQDQIGIIALEKSVFEACGCTTADADGLANMALEVQGVRMAFLITERDDCVKVSMRAMEPYTVNDIAQALGGGGHAQAAGVSLHMTLAEAERLILQKARAKLEDQ